MTATGSPTEAEACDGPVATTVRMVPRNWALAGACIICCQDYDENYVVGDLTRASIRDVLAGEEMARIRRWTYGVEEAPADFICRTCVFALTR